MSLANLRQHLPTPIRVFAGIQDTYLLLKMRWAGIDKWYSRLFLVAGLALILGLIVAVSYAGFFIRNLAQDGAGNETAQEYALTYLAIFQNGELGTIGATALGLSVISAIVAPLGGAVRTFIISPREVESFPLTRWHRFSDSLVAQAFSVISLLQLTALTAITSLIVLEGGREVALLFTWAIWLALVGLSVCATWAAEYLHRSFGPKVRFAIVGGLALILGVALLFDPNHGKTLFGIGTAYSDAISTASQTTSFADVAFMLAVPLAIAAALFFVGALVSSISLSRPEYLPVNINEEQTVKKVRTHRTFKTPELELLKTLVLAIARSPEGRKPIIAVLLIGIAGALLLGGQQAVSVGFILMVPLVAALAWGANAFGVIGNGLPWLSNQPRLFARLPWLLFGLQVVVTLALFTAIWLPAIVLGKVGASGIISIATGAVATTFIVSRSSMQKSIKTPHPMYFGMRNESLLPPLTTIGYTFRFTFWAGQYGLLTASVGNVKYQVIAMFAAVVWSLIRMARINYKWQNDIHVRRKVLTTFSQA